MFEKRIEKVRKMLSEKGIDTLMVLIEENRRYLSGFTGEDTQFDESAGVLLINNRDLILATDSRFDLQANSESPAFKVVLYTNGLHQELPAVLDSLKTKRLGYESSRMSCSQFRKISEELKTKNSLIELVPVENFVEELRLLKEENEVEETSKALDIAEIAFDQFIEKLEPDMTEREAAWDLEKKMRENGADSLSFPVIVASGANSALPHAIPGDRKIGRHEPIVIDWGTRFNGYCSDITRTFTIGKPDAEFIKVHQTVLEAQSRAIEQIKPGISCRAVDEIARSHINESGFKDKFGHGLGHGTGLAVHELPRISKHADGKLEEGMIFTVEPGIYLPGWGGVRIENMVVVRNDGAEVLNNSNPGFREIGG